MLPPTAKFGVISDIDDTVVRTQATDMLQMARIVFLNNARTRLPFEGVAGFYRALQQGASGQENNPIFYVSSSPWNLYDLFIEFFAFQGIPTGPILLRDLGLSQGKRLAGGHEGHKLSKIQPLLDLYPELPFILIGDSGQKDAEIYRQVVHDYPGRILAVYIRNVSPEPERQEEIRALAQEVQAAGSQLLLAQDTLAAARHAVQHNWIATEALQAVRIEKEVDERNPNLLEQL
jgi:phosphatidate phosphatase APP1